MILLNPGPVNVSERVRKALQRPDICHRESEFSDLLMRIQKKLLQAFVPDRRIRLCGRRPHGIGYSGS